MPVLSNRQLGQFASVSDFNYIPKRSANPCGLTPINLVGEEELEGVQPKLRILEKTLGFHAGSVDDHLDDVVLWFRPTNAWWWGIAKEAASLILEYGVGTLAAPFVCAWNAVFGWCSATAAISMIPTSLPKSTI